MIYLKNPKERNIHFTSYKLEPGDNMILTDYHVHTKFSGDSDAKFDDIISSAVSLGLKEICITDHQDYDFYADGVLFELNADEYFNTLCEISKQYASVLTIKKGIETGLEPVHAMKLHQLITSYPFDFVIGSSHLINGYDPYYPAYFEGKTDEQAFTEYFESIITNLEHCNDFDVYGHIDYVVRYCPNKNKNYSYEKFHGILDTILAKLIDMGKGIEINTSGYRSGLNAPNPCLEIVKRYRELGGEIITIGSDAHSAKDIGYRFSDAENILKACGFRYYTKFENRKPVFIKI